MKTFSIETAIKELNNGKTQIVDVREPLEFASKSLDGAINMPSSKFSLEKFEELKNKTLVIICQSGGRAKMVYDNLRDNGFEDIFVSDKHMAEMEFSNTEHKTVSSISWSVDRQFRMTLGVLLTIFLIGYFNVSEYFIIIPIILATGLVVTSIINRCYMKIGISMLPWNKDKTCSA